jgi:WD40 repeat protein
LQTLACSLTWKAKFEATPGWQLRPSYLATLGSSAGRQLDASGLQPSTGPLPPSSPTQLLSSLSLSPPRQPGTGRLLSSSSTSGAYAPPSYKALYAKRLWVARRFGRNNPYRPSSSADSLAADLVVSERELSGHSDSIYALAFDGAKVLTGSRDRSIKVWDVDSGRLLETITDAHRASVLCIAFEEVGPEAGGRGALAVSGGSDGVVALWDLGGASSERALRYRLT